MSAAHCGRWWLRTLTLALVALSNTANTLPAQNQPAVFVHGFFSQAAAWRPGAQYLIQRFQIDTLLLGLPWDRPFDEQADAAHTAINAWGQSQGAALAHSNGGLVSRNYIRRTITYFGDSPRYRRLATIGTPHGGAPIADAVLSGALVNFFAGGAQSVFRALDFYAANDPDWYLAPVVNSLVSNALGSMGALFGIFADNNRMAGLGIGAALPVTIDDRPGSTFLTALNGPQNLQLESAFFTSRVGISTQVDPYGAFFQLVTTQPDNARIIAAVAQYGALILYNYYSEHPDYNLNVHADYWLDIYDFIGLLDVAWGAFTGSLVRFDYILGNYYAVFDHSDGFIPQSHSQFPNATNQYILARPANPNIPHTLQNTSATTLALFDNVFANDFGIPRKP
jgi:pimeloyl-ACP methyl ester carboxylesterase